MTIADNTFAAACFDQSSIQELEEALRGQPDETDCAEWDLTAEEWREQIILALKEKRESDECHMAGENLPVQYTNSQSETPEGFVSYRDFTVTDAAEPTSRALDGSDDHGSAEEWAEPGYVTLLGEKREASCVYLFTHDEIAEIEDPENYPWDAGHVARILLQD